MINKQNLWFLTLFSLILVLSVYYITMPNDLLTKDEPVGKKIDFLIQEMNRETNTIGSKSNKLEITNLVIEIKTELEDIREQIQNIE